MIQPPGARADTAIAKRRQRPGKVEGAAGETAPRGQACHVELEVPQAVERPRRLCAGHRKLQAGKRIGKRIGFPQEERAWPKSDPLVTLSFGWPGGGTPPECAIVLRPHDAAAPPAIPSEACHLQRNGTGRTLPMAGPGPTAWSALLWPEYLGHGSAASQFTVRVYDTD